MNALLFLMLLALVVWFWQENLRYREYAIQQCRKVCREMNLQLLDQTVAMTSVNVRRDHNKKFRIQRKYGFEVSMDGANRFKGYIVLLGLYIIHTEFDLPDGPVILQNNKLISYH
jgi:hypothetical protein